MVIPVHNQLDAVLDLFETLELYGQAVNNVYVIDDHSEEYIGAQLRAWCDKQPAYQYFRNPTNLGFVKSVNFGFSLCETELICLLNSDVVLTSGWLEKMISFTDADPRVGVVNPLTNNAPFIEIPLPPGYSIHMMADRLDDLNSTSEPVEIVTGVGFCWLIRRSLITDYGGFDEIFSPGYCEEADFAMRIKSHGNKVVLALNDFVYHRGGTSFKETGNQLYIRNRRVFDARWESMFEQQESSFCRDDPLKELKEVLYTGLNDGPNSIFHRRDYYRTKLAKALQMVRNKQYSSLVSIIKRNLRKEVGAALEKRFTVPEPSTEDLFTLNRTPDLKTRNMFPDKEYITKLPKTSTRLKIAFLLWDMTTCGGVNVIIDLVNGLIAKGHDATIVTVDPTYKPEYYRRLLTRPLVYRDLKMMKECFLETDILIATYWATAYYWYKELKSLLKCPTAYFVQDFEPDFFNTNSEDYKRAIGTYFLNMPHIVTSQWLKDKLRNIGVDSAVIPIGLDLGVYHPRERSSGNNEVNEFTITGMVRPHTPHRGFSTFMETCRIIHSRDSTIKFVVFGCDQREIGTTDLPIRSVGIIENQHEMARHLSSCDLLLDTSDFQAFGRCALESMACGTPTVITDTGGAKEYAVDGHNSLIAATGNAEDFAEKTLRIKRDTALHKHIAKNGLATAQKFSHRKVVEHHLSYYQELIGSQY